MSINYLKLDSSKLVNYVYLGDVLERRKFLNLGKSKQQKIYKFVNFNGLKALSLIQLDKKEKSVDEKEVRKNEIKNYRELKITEKIEESFSSGYEVAFGNIYAYPNQLNGLATNDLYVDSITKTVKSKFMLDVDVPNINNVSSISEFTNYINARDLPIDFEGTFGKLFFNGMIGYNFKRDELGEITQEIDSIKYEIISTKQGMFNVIIEGSELVDVAIGSEIEIIDFFVDNYVYPPTKTFGYKAYATNIKPKNSNNKVNINELNKEDSKENKINKDVK